MTCDQLKISGCTLPNPPIEDVGSETIKDKKGKIVYIANQGHVLKCALSPENQNIHRSGRDIGTHHPCYDGGCPHHSFDS